MSSPPNYRLRNDEPSPLVSRRTVPDGFRDAKPVCLCGLATLSARRRRRDARLSSVASASASASTSVTSATPTRAFRSPCDACHRLVTHSLAQLGSACRPSRGARQRSRRKLSNTGSASERASEKEMSPCAGAAATNRLGCVASEPRLVRSASKRALQPSGFSPVQLGANN